MEFFQGFWVSFGKTKSQISLKRYSNSSQTTLKVWLKFGGHIIKVLGREEVGEFLVSEKGVILSLSSITVLKPT